ncbi:MAG: hypothetical protein HQL73_12470 [Magnetococcales bacterium]|nr:hypothetical protein [Magnetococcales bacterium]
MTTTFDHAHRVNALSLGDNVGLVSGDLPPSAVDTSSFPIGSVYFQTNGRVWKRFSTDASGWMELGYPFFFFILADSTAVFIPWVAPGILPLILADGSIGTLTLGN